MVFSELLLLQSYVVALGTHSGPTVGFISEDSTRDTISLIVSCLVTLMLCVYSAVHLNVPAKCEHFGRIAFRDFKWCMIGLFGPELVLYTAWRQWASAKQFCEEVHRLAHLQDAEGKELNSINNDKIASTQDPDRVGRVTQSWTMAHGFYISMGGFAIDLEDIETSPLAIFGNSRRLTLTAKGAALLAHCGRLPYISSADIGDKNKADALAKCLVCVQSGWMIVQVISRRATGLPITLLEFHTVAHVVCTLLMYIIWWHKPRQVTSPTLIRGDWVLPLAAYMFSASRMSGERPRGIFAGLALPQPELKELAYFETSFAPSESAYIASMHGEDLVRPARRGYFGPRSRDLDQSSAIQPTSPFSSTQEQVERLKLAADAVAQYPALRAKFFSQTEESAVASAPSVLLPYTSELVQAQSMNWPNAGLLRRTQSLVMGMVLWGASMAYGAIHVAAWNSFFPTKVEQLLWRLSSAWVTYCAAHWLLTNFLAHFFPSIDRIWEAYNERRLQWFWFVIITILCIVCGVSYIASRAFLVIEAFISIREVPRDVYATPGWTKVFPHL